jgi:hypothetical protein
MYLPANDRRHYVAWSDLTIESFEASYWAQLYSWYGQGGDSDALDDLGNPPVVRLQQILLLRPNSPFADWLADRKNSRLIPHRFEKCGYVRVRYEGATDGQWKVNGKRQAIYGRNDISFRDRYGAALKMAGRSV